MTIKLKYIGTDSWNRPVYEDENGRLWKDTNLDSVKNKAVDKPTYAAVATIHLMENLIHQLQNLVKTLDIDYQAIEQYQRSY